ncbi:MAG: GTP-binding protein [Chloroherpetonaceae bacterium]|nr:GTP-binding protein [Chloroherpetonaceae bacterium]
MQHERIPTIIITGFLGSGKTTLIKHLLNTSLKDRKVALIENEIGEVSVDTTILKTQNVEISELTAGCMCCTISGDFSNAVTDILSGVTPDVLLIETTGIANPISIFMMLANDQRLILDTIITVADAERLEDNLAENLVAEIQLTISDLVVLNKTDVCSEAALLRAEKLIRQMNERAPIFRTVQGQIPPELIFAPKREGLREELRAQVLELKKKYDAEIERRLHLKRAEQAALASPTIGQPAPAHNHHHEHGAESYHLEVDQIETFAFERPEVFVQRKFEELLATLPRYYYRAKGIVNFVEMQNPTIFNFASGRYTFDYETLQDEDFRKSGSSSLFVFIGKQIAGEREQMLERLLACKAY